MFAKGLVIPFWRGKLCTRLPHALSKQTGEDKKSSSCHQRIGQLQASISSCTPLRKETFGLLLICTEHTEQRSERCHSTGPWMWEARRSWSRGARMFMERRMRRLIFFLRTRNKIHSINNERRILTEKVDFFLRTRNKIHSKNNDRRMRRLISFLGNIIHSILSLSRWAKHLLPSTTG